MVVPETMVMPGTMVDRVADTRRLARPLHPAAWWLWAIGLATAAARTTNPLLLGMIIGVVCVVVANRRGDAVWAFAFRFYLIAAAAIVVLRVVFRIIFGGGTGVHILFTLPEIPLPEAAAGIRLLGPVAAEQVLSGFYDGLRLATMLICLGAANALANPKRMLRAVPAALYEVGTAVVVALSMAPQLVESALRVNRARRLRGGRESGLRTLRRIAIPVLVDAMDRSLLLAAAMDARGYGRRGDQPRAARTASGALVLTGLIGICVGIYALLDGTAPRVLAGPMLAAGAVVAAIGLLVAGRQVRRTVYRPDRWRLAEILVALCGIGVAAVFTLTANVDPMDLYPSLTPLTWPQLAPLPVAGVLLGVLPAWIAPPPPVAPAGTAPAPRLVLRRRELVP
jgi:energy-coupling factor transport system permease protein